ncbi:BRCT domain-containing protein [Alishewanella sp. HL-SH06]|uniref:BRCT domain-containing protein n=1 Tax=Alishewanella sp. HL-SH06 TaxID=3461144 RepID=UPI004042F622
MMKNTKAHINKSVNTLIGIVEGIAVDQLINDQEIAFLNLWLAENVNYLNQHPFNELIPVIENALADSVLTSEEKEDILWLCDKLTSTEYFDLITAGIQRLHGILGAIACDNKITEAELRGLRGWLNDHSHLKTIWPYDEVDALITHVLADGSVSADEQRSLLNFFMEFSVIADDKTITTPSLEGKNLIGVCAICPDILFDNKIFCFTGESSRFKRSELAKIVSSVGGIFANKITQKTNYLVIGSNGNPCWAYSCYGRKVEHAIKLRQTGIPLVILHENDFYDAIADI